MLAKHLLLLASVSVSPHVFADVLIYNNLGPADAYAVQGYGSSAPLDAVPFQTTATAELDTILAPLFILGGSEPVTLSLAQNSAGLPGSILESWSVTLPTSLMPPLTTVQSVLHPELVASDQYWFIVDETTFGREVSWYYNDQTLIAGACGSPRSRHQLYPNFP